MERWTNKETRRLIELMEENLFLFDINHRDYINRDKKRAAIAYITAQMSSVKQNLTVRLVENKIKNLRDQYVKERKKAESSRKSGAGPGGFYDPKWAYYDFLHFTYVDPRVRQAVSSCSTETSTLAPLTSSEEAAPTMTISFDLVFEDSAVGIGQEASKSVSLVPSEETAPPTNISFGVVSEDSASDIRQETSSPVSLTSSEEAASPTNISSGAVFEDSAVGIRQETYTPLSLTSSQETASPLNISSGTVFEDSARGLRPISQSTDPLLEATRAAQVTLSTSRANQRLHELSQKREEASNERTKDFLAFLGHQISKVEDNDIFEELIENICLKVFAAKARQRARRQRSISSQQPTLPPSPPPPPSTTLPAPSTAPTSPPPPTDTMYPKSSTTIPSMVAYVFQNRFSSPASTFSSSPITCNSESSCSTTTMCSFPSCSRPATISSIRPIPTRLSHPSIKQSMKDSLQFPPSTSTSLVQFTPNVCILSPSPSFPSPSSSSTATPSIGSSKHASSPCVQTFPSPRKPNHHQPQPATSCNPLEIVSAEYEFPIKQEVTESSNEMTNVDATEIKKEEVWL